MIKQGFSLAMLLISPLLLASQTAEQLYSTAGGYGCSACHGKYANGAGNVGGNIRGASFEQLQIAFEQQPTMQLLGKSLSDIQKMKLIAYLDELSNSELLEWTIDLEPESNELELTTSKPAQLVIFNALLEPVVVDLSPLGGPNSLEIAAYSSHDWQWLPTPGNYSLTVGTRRLTLVVPQNTN
ncbi:cytochrome c [Alginatibacterium sediminis]|uniref:Cytochrome c n=1 Tax=Alginatibacterium sediminis TaxID=2164068 RepID=A0A420EHF1_9ALTE|nr:cytochrome c [Alginatibacterium sediminis]RKF20090.1 cytochrome c [Alginatibacterium sediminis]